MNELLASSLLTLRQLEQHLFQRSLTVHTGTHYGSWWVKNRPYRHVVQELARIGISGAPPPIALRLLSVWQGQPMSAQADALFCKSHARAFYPADGWTVKFAGPHDRIRNELAVRSSVLPTNDIIVPTIHQGCAGETPFIVEELIFGGTRITQADMTANFAGKLWAFYEHNGIAPIALSQIIDQADLAADLERALTYLGAPLDPVMAAWDVVRKSLSWDCPVPVGLCHGDLADSNMLKKDGKLVLLDWENAHRGLIFNDLAKLNAKFAGVSELVVEPYEQWCRLAKSKALPISHLLCLCLMWSFVTHWKEINNSSRAPTRKLAHRLIRLQSAIARI